VGKPAYANASVGKPALLLKPHPRPLSGTERGGVEIEIGDLILYFTQTLI